MNTCGCGIPNHADFHVHVTISRDVPGGTETSYVDIYVCVDHMTDDTRSLLRFDDADAWEIVETRTTEIV